MLIAFLASLIGAFAVQKIYQQIYTWSLTEAYLNDVTEAMDSEFDTSLYVYTTHLMGYFEENREYFFNNDNLENYVGRDHIYDEINLIDENGIIAYSSNPDYIGYDMDSGEQSREFLCLLHGTDYYIQDLKEISYDKSIAMKYIGVAYDGGGGFLQAGIERDHYCLLKEEMMVDTVAEHRVGITGFALVCDMDRKIVASTKDEYNGQIIEDINLLPETEGEYEKTVQNIFGRKCYILAEKRPDYYVLCCLPESEAERSGLINIILTAAMFVLILVCVLIGLTVLVRKHVLRGVEDILGSLKKITSGDLDERADFRDSSELDELSDGINFTVDRLKELIKEAEERIDAELSLAAKIQNSFIPHQFPPFPDRDEFELYAAMVPAKEVGGDFYDFFLIDEDHLALVIADVSGKGIPAALFMVMTKDKLRHSVQKYGTDTAAAVREVNLELCRENDAGLFVTVWLGVVTISTGHVDYVDAGHEYPAICRRGQEFTADEDVHCAPVAARKKTEFEAGSFELGVGDVLYLYTDGVTEANDPAGEMFRRGRMLKALNDTKDSPVELIDAAVRKAISEFIQDTPQFDDTTTMVFRYRGKTEADGSIVKPNENEWFDTLFT